MATTGKPYCLVMLNLITDPWLPVRRLHSGRCTIRPAQIAENIADDPVIAIDWPRADFRVATLELLIGLLATACPPREHDSWLELWDKPPDRATLDSAYAPTMTTSPRSPKLR